LTRYKESLIIPTVCAAAVSFWRAGYVLDHKTDYGYLHTLKHMAILRVDEIILTRVPTIIYTNRLKKA